MSKQPKTMYLNDYQPNAFVVDDVYLDFELGEEQTHVRTVLKLHRNTAHPQSNAPLVLNGEKMQLQSVMIDDRVLDDSEFSADAVSLTINDVPDQFVLQTHVVIKPQDNKALMGLYKSRNNFCTQCEAEGFRYITYFFDRPDVMTRFTTTITADRAQYPMLLANGNLIDIEELADNKHKVTWQDPSLKPCYLFALVAGNFDLLEDNFTTMSGRDVALKLYLEPGFKDQGAYALESLKKAMAWDEQTFGREYDLDIYMIVAVSDFNMGAMENKGLNVFNTKYVLARPDTATDSDYVAIEGVIGHEYFHNWTGNRVTCRDWFQITLKEGLTVFRDQTFTEDMTSKAVSRLDTINVVRTQQFAEDAGPLAHPIRTDSYIEINNFYTLTVYRKGCEVIRMIRTLITPENFHKGMDLYFERHDGQAVTTEEFVKAMEDASGKDLTQFRRWYSQAGTPELSISSDYDVEQQQLTLHVAQSCPATPGQEQKEPFQLPLSMGLIGPDCNELGTQLIGEDVVQPGTRILEITEPEQTFTFINVPENTVPSLLRDFSAPVKLEYAYTDEQLAWLIKCDANFFSRWNAAQQLATNSIIKLAEQHLAGQEFSQPEHLIDAMGALLQQDADDLNYLSRLLMLPSLAYLMANSHKMPVSAVHEALQFCKKSLAKQHEALFQELYNKLHDGQSYVYNVAEMGKRSLKNVCLSYLTALENEQHYATAYQQFSTADNMTDQMGALSALNHHDCKQREQALNEFYQRWQHEPLVVNKWLMLQSASVLPDTVDRVRGLLTHDAFDIENPNNVYALVCGFGANMARFHNSGGKGYEFVADQVLTLDAQNPQVAARVIAPLTRWQQFDEADGKQMRAQLERIAAVDGLSSDIYEVVTKSLA